MPLKRHVHDSRTIGPKGGGPATRPENRPPLIKTTYLMKRLKYFAGLLALVASAAGCDDGDPKVDATHAITVAQNEFCRIDVKTEEAPGEKVPVTVTLLDAGRRIEAVTYNDNPCRLLSGSGMEYRYEFTMPDREVTLAVRTEARVPDKYAIRAEQNEYFEIAAPESAGGGKLLA